MENLTDHLPFWHFFHELEKQLSYERWTDKYKLFLGQLYNPGYLTDNNKVPEKRLLQLCKALYLQDIRDENAFEVLFDEAWQKENKFLESIFGDLQAKKTIEENEKPDKNRARKKEIEEPIKPLVNDSSVKEDSQQETQKTEPVKSATKEYYYNPPEIPQIPDSSITQAKDDKNKYLPGSHEFNFNDEYLPITRREMNKAWQYLRHGEAGSLTDVVNIEATVNKLAREVIFTEPVFVCGKRNREDTLLLFVDCNGSMVPFHELSRRLVKSAKTFGGHRNAQVFYFQNYPSGYVYERSNLTKPCKTIEALAKANKQFTTAVIISDAGFARGFGNDNRYITRITYLVPFLKALTEHCARILWLNPMPENRWHKPTAKMIQSMVLEMAPVLEKGMNTFQNILRNLLKAKVTSINV